MSRCGTTRTEPLFYFECWFDTEHLPSDSEVRLGRASRSAKRQRGLKRTGTRASDMSRHERRLQQVDD